MSTKLDIVNTGLLMANANTINSFDDSTREAQMSKAIYDTTIEAQLSKHPWGFSMFQEALARTPNTPLFDYRYEFQLPTDYIRIFKIDSPAANDYRVMKDKLFTDNEAVEVLFQKDPGPAFYPAYFRRLCEFKFAELFSKMLVQDDRMGKEFKEDYLLSMREARGIDSQNSPNLTINELSLVLTAVRGAEP